MRKTYPNIIILAASALLLLGTGVAGVGCLMEDRVEVSREKVHADYGFTRAVFENCPIEKAELNTSTRELVVYFPREEYRDLCRRLEHQGWAELKPESGEFRLGRELIRVKRGELTIYPAGLASR